PWGDVGEAYPRYRGGDRAELAADTRRRLRLGVERVVVTRPAQRPDEDAVDVADLLPLRRRGLPAGEQGRQRQAQAGQRPDAQQLAACDSPTVRCGGV